VGPADAKLSMRKDTHVRRLGELPLILTMRPNSLRLMVEDRLGVHGLTANVRVEANTLPLMTDLVTAGLGYTVLPMCGVRELLKQGRISASPIADLFVTWLVARPKSRPLGVAAERFHDVLCEFSRKLIARGVWQQT
jgi:LysR family nitrogen assimilation transcriptional regulator